MRGKLIVYKQKIQNFIIDSGSHIFSLAWLLFDYFLYFLQIYLIPRASRNIWEFPDIILFWDEGKTINIDSIFTPCYYSILQKHRHTNRILKSIMCILLVTDCTKYLPLPSHWSGHLIHCPMRSWLLLAFLKYIYIFCMLPVEQSS